MRRKVHYVIEPQYLWASIAEMARTQDVKLLNTLQAGFKYIEEESFSSVFRGLFSEINLASEKIGKTYGDRNDRLCKIIKEIAEGLKQFSTDNDTLGDAYEYLIGQFAAGSGKKLVSSTRPNTFQIFYLRLLRWIVKSLPLVSVHTWTACLILPAGQDRCYSIFASAWENMVLAKYTGKKKYYHLQLGTYEYASAWGKRFRV